MDLLLKQKIKIDINKELLVSVVDNDPTNIQLLDRMIKKILEMLEKSKIKIKYTTKEKIFKVPINQLKEKSRIPTLINLYRSFKYYPSRDLLISRLNEFGYVKYLEKKFLIRRYEICKPKVKLKILDEIYSIVNSKIEMDNQDIPLESLFLLSLLRINKSYNKIIDLNLKQKKAFRQITASEHLGRWLQKRINRSHRQSGDFTI